MSILYFAYDEKMFFPFFKQVAPSAVCLGVAKLPGYKLYFHSHSFHDCSGKCNIVPNLQKNAVVYGVLYEISAQDKVLIEDEVKIGQANQAAELMVFPVAGLLRSANINQSGQKVLTHVACKENIYQDLVPFSWYKKRVIQGAREHHLPKEYISLLEQYACAQDPNLQRDLQQNRVLNIQFL